MRLNSIKLAGFKSFAEPTTFQLPGQLKGRGFGKGLEAGELDRIQPHGGRFVSP